MAFPMQRQRFPQRWLRSLNSLAASSRAGISGGGGGGAMRKKLSRMNKPRFTGEVRVGFEVTARTVPCVSIPPRGLSGGQLHQAHFISATSGSP